MKKYDPMLREAMTEINGILEKYDIAGFIALISPTHAEFKLTIDKPSWSNLRFLKDGKAVHFKVHMKSDPENTEATAHALYSLRDLCALGFGQTNDIIEMVEKIDAVKVEHTPFGGSGINNDDR